jgi:hypothetical protein
VLASILPQSASGHQWSVADLDGAIAYGSFAIGGTVKRCLPDGLGRGIAFAGTICGPARPSRGHAARLVLPNAIALNTAGDCRRYASVAVALMVFCHW